MTTPVRTVKPCPQPFSDHVVANLEGVDLPIRVFPAVGSGQEGTGTGKGKRPWLFWIHGGGFVSGKHYVPNVWVHPAFHPEGIHIVSVSYRFIPQVTLPELWQDILLAFQWCREHLPSIVGGDGDGAVDLDRYIVGGDSAGGHLASYAGLGPEVGFDPKPTVVLDIFGVIDLTDPYISKPFDIPIQFGTPLEVLHELSTSHDASKARVTGAWTWEIEPEMSVDLLRTFWGEDYTPSDKDRLLMDLNSYLVKEGTRLDVMFRSENLSKDEFEQAKHGWSPLHRVRRSLKDDSRHRSQYPPTVVMHGRKDFVVPIKQSEEFADRLEENGTEVLRIWSEEGGHSFEQAIGVSGVSL
ncbi:hypothetical protein I316_05672 [Kwoniella heveanensis BCC8398]|uniref:Alpha/beta hydrolase fold-3 domain-containing protein n=1 Tax=Kwoniella heveanensis BCC8398 TaxID=1296120 RepID=A0A1B9GP13_9TREE|nr:hypothetical protein I316_05672 [Kwoniella heveanensis BCC8398]